MRNLVRRVLGTLDPRRTSVQLDLGRLNEVRSGIGTDAAEYVLTGHSEMVLSSLHTLGGGEKLGIANRYRNSTAVAETERSARFLSVDPYDLSQLARYARVLEAAATRTPPDGLAGSEKAPLSLRILLFEASIANESYGFGRADNEKKPKLGLTPDHLTKLAEELDATATDIFDIFYWDTGTYGRVTLKALRKRIDLSDLANQKPANVVEAAERLQANGRAALLKDLNTWKFAGQSPFIELLVAQAGESAKTVREAAFAILKSLPEEKVIPLAKANLATGNVNLRAGMVRLLASMRTAETDEILSTHLKTEKTARIIADIENARSTAEIVSKTGTEDDESGYIALDGTRVEVPPFNPIDRVEPVSFGPALEAELNAFIMNANKRIEAENAERRKTRKNAYQAPKFQPKLAKAAIRLLSGGAGIQKERNITHLLNFQMADLTRKALKEVPLDQKLAISMAAEYALSGVLSSYVNTPTQEALAEYLSSETADLRALEALGCDIGIKFTFGGWRNRTQRSMKKGDFMRVLLPEEAYNFIPPETFPKSTIWPYIAANLDIVDEAMGLRPVTQEPVSRVAAICYIAVLPKTPSRYFGPLLEAATGTAKAGRAEARALLEDVPEVSGQLISLLDDTRQAIRAGAAEWISERRDKDAIDAMKKRLKKEKSEIARAAILTALKLLDVSLDDYVGPAALINEAEAGLKKARFDKLDWLNMDHMPALKFAGGKAVPANVIRWWVFLAFKLKQPGGNSLFEIWLDQLQPDDAAAFSLWLFEAWTAYDTAKPSDEEANAHAKANAKQRLKAWARWYADWTEEDHFNQLRREFLSNYLNSGAASKGLLGLATRIPPQILADRVRTYLKNHGSRNSQASAQLELLAAKGDPVSLQVLISAATRLKQKGVQAFAGELVQKVADRMEWTLEELSDRTIPSAGLDDDGILELPCGPDEKMYRATLAEDLTLVLTNPDGKVVKALSSGTDDTTKASKKQLSASRKELKQVISMQTSRYYEGLCAQKTWLYEAWQRDFRDHPVMRRLTERVVWEGLDADGQPLATFRPTAEGEYTDAQDEPVDPREFAQLRLTHGAMLPPDTANAWEQHLQDYEIKPLFAQFGRALKTLPSDMADADKIADREGWLTDTFTLRGAATRAGYERGETMDGGSFDEYRKSFRSAGLTAVVGFTGSYLPEENIPAALTSLSFQKGSRLGVSVKLSEVPAVLLSECWNDYHTMAAKAAFDPDWKKKGLW